MSRAAVALLTLTCAATAFGLRPRLFAALDATVAIDTIEARTGLDLLPELTLRRLRKLQFGNRGGHQGLISARSAKRNAQSDAYSAGARLARGDFEPFPWRAVIVGVADANGNVFNPSNADFAIARFTTAGTLDPTFSGDGLATASSAGTSTDDTPRGVAIGTDGVITVVLSGDGVQQLESHVRAALER